MSVVLSRQICGSPTKQSPPERLSDPALASWPLPPMVLLSLMENAIKHGPWAGHSGVIALDAAADDEALTLTLSNPGPYRGPGEGRGLELLHRRLALLYHGRATCTLRQEGDRTIAALVIPRREETDDDAGGDRRR